MALWLLNPPKKRTTTRRRKMAAKRKKRPSRKQLIARRKFAAMSRARGKAARRRKTTRTRKRSPVMAKRRRRKATTAVRRRRPRRGKTMRSVKRASGASVARRPWRASGYRRNPRRRSVRRRNPFGMGGIAGEIMSLGKQTVAVMAGRYLGRTISGLIPFGGTSVYMNAAKGAAVALLIKRFGRKVVSGDLADALAIGALLGPVNDLILSVAPAAAGFLSGGPMAFPTFPGRPIGTYARMGSYSDGQTSDFDDSTFVGSYSSQDYQNQ